MTLTNYIEGLSLSKTTADEPAAPGLEGALESFRRESDATPPRDTAPLPADLKAAVDAGSLLSFVEGLSVQEREDVLYSVQLAQRAATGQFDRFTQTQLWYQKYLEVLENVGWAAEQFAFTKFDQSEGALRMDKAALAVIAAIATQNQLAVLQQSIHALESLAEKDKEICLFDFHTSVEMSGNFQIGAVQKADGALSFALGGFYFRSADSRRRFIFFSWGKHDVNFWTAAQKMTLNQRLYAQCRDAVRATLGEKAQEFIAALKV